MSTEPQIQAGKQQYLSFIVDNEEYGIDIMSVREITQWITPRPLPAVPDYIRGVINLRGAIIPLIDLRIRFGIKPVEKESDSVVVVLRDPSGENPRMTGLIVDTVSDIHHLDGSTMQQPPKYLKSNITQYLVGMFNIDENVLMIIDSHFVLQLGEKHVDTEIGAE